MSFDNLIELFPELNLEAGLTNIQYDFIADHANEVPYLLKAYFQAANKLAKLESEEAKYEQEATRKELEEVYASLGFERDRYRRLVKAIQNV